MRKRWRAGGTRADAQSQRWRIPATEIEGAVVAALRSFLEDGSALSAPLSLGRLPPSRAANVLKAAAALSRSLGQNHAAQSRSLLQSFLSRIEIGVTTLTLTVALGRLREALGFADLDEPQSHAIIVPLRVAKRGVEQKLVIGAGAMAPGPRDESLVKALARAHAWFEDIRSQRAKDVSELAAREGLPRSYVAMRLNEICALDVEDVKETAGILFFELTEAKTEAGVRVVPVHSAIIDAGFRDYCRAIKNGSLWPGLKPGGPDGKLSWYVSKRFTDYRRKLGLVDIDKVTLSDRIDFHSLRRSAITALKHANVPEHDAAEVVGHEHPRVTFGVYPDRQQLARLKDIVEAIRYRV